MEQEHRFIICAGQKRKKHSSNNHTRPNRKSRCCTDIKFLASNVLHLLCVYELVLFSISEAHKVNLDQVTFADGSQQEAFDLQRIAAQPLKAGRTSNFSISRGSSQNVPPAGTSRSASSAPHLAKSITRHSSSLSAPIKPWGTADDNLDASSSQQQVFSECALILQRTYIRNENDHHE